MLCRKATNLCTLLLVVQQQILGVIIMLCYGKFQNALNLFIKLSAQFSESLNCYYYSQALGAIDCLFLPIQFFCVANRSSKLEDAKIQCAPFLVYRTRRVSSVESVYQRNWPRTYLEQRLLFTFYAIITHLGNIFSVLFSHSQRVMFSK